VTGTFHAFQSDMIAALRQAGPFRQRLLVLRANVFRRYQFGQISLVSPYADALSLIWKGQPPYQVSQTFMRALASLAHEEFHAISQEWIWIVLDRQIGTPSLDQLREGLAELAVQEYLPSILSLMKMAPLRKSLHFLDSRKNYVQQREAPRALVGQAAATLAKPNQDILKSLVGNGAGVIALRLLAHEIARHTARADRYPDAQWLRRRFQNPLPSCGEQMIVEELLAPFAELADSAA
jgi:hypothetical protein